MDKKIADFLGAQIYDNTLNLNYRPFDGMNTPYQKIDKTIEIITVPKLADPTKNQKNVGIVLDGDLIQEILAKNYEAVIITEINNHDDLDRLVTRNPDLVFSGVKYFDFLGKRLWLNDYLDLFGIPYIASNKKALDCESDKSRAKAIVRKAGIATANYFTARPGEHPTEKSIPIAFPLFVKPVTGGDSRGVDANSVVSDFSGFLAKVAEIQDLHQSRSLAETYLSGKEYSVGIFEDIATGRLTAMPIEIIVEENQNGARVLDFDTKRNDTEKVIAVTDRMIRTQLSDLAKSAFKALDGKSFGRIDIMMSHDGFPHFVEANLMPGLGKGYFYRACKLNLDMNYEQMISKIAESGLALRSTK
jgi:D-alanine-D-alanine ligase